MSLRVELQFRDEGADLSISLPHPEARIRSAGTFFSSPPIHEGDDVPVHAVECLENGTTPQGAPQQKLSQQRAF